MSHGGAAAVAERAPGSLIPDQRLGLGIRGLCPGCHTVIRGPGSRGEKGGAGMGGRELVDVTGGGGGSGTDGILYAKFKKFSTLNFCLWSY